MIRSVLVYALLNLIKATSRVFYRHELIRVGEVPPDPWDGIRLVAFLNHTSLFEPVFLGIVPGRFLWRIARHGVIPAADKTIQRPLVGLFYRFVARHVVSITRERDHTWAAVLAKIEPGSVVVMAPEGRMKRATGLDANGRPMTVRGGVSDVLEALRSGRMLVAYSEGLHHVQVPGGVPRIFKTVRVRVEVIDIASYVAPLMARGGPEGFKSAVKEDLERRRDLYCPTDSAAG